MNCFLFGASNCGFQPEEGLKGKDGSWIATPQVLVEKMLQLAKITPKDYLIDLGSGDGRMVITAAQLGTSALGIEYNPNLVKLAKRNAEKEAVANKAQFREAVLFEFDFSKTPVISMFLLPEINLKLRPKLLNFKPGTRIVSNTFTMQEWHYDAVAKIGDGSSRWNTAYLLIIPAKVEGKWVLSQGGELLLQQEFLMLTGSMVIGNKIFKISEGRIRGKQISFKTNGAIYTGLVTGSKIEGTYATEGKSKDWSATAKVEANRKN